MEPGTRYADLHFHTHYSDNRDRASVEEMILRGRGAGITIFGTGDHNHNLTAEEVRAQLQETASVRARHPGLVIMNNIEMTFLIGHFHVFAPGEISGTVDEAYRFLAGVREGLMMANHPGLPTDEWNARINPRFAAVEVINGAVLAEGRRQGLTLRTALNLPSVTTYIRYLRLGLPVAALGGSDAHALDELGTGFTGFHLGEGATRGEVLEEIRQRRCFATTSPTIDLHWELDEGARLFKWAVAVGEQGGTGRSGAAGGVTAPDYTVELYCGGERLAEVHPPSRRATGTLDLDRPGCYWLAVIVGSEVAISSPSAYRLSDLAIASESRKLVRVAEARLDEEVRSIDLSATELAQRRTLSSTGTPEVSLLTTAPQPVLLDRDGAAVRYRIAARTPERPVIAKECEPREFKEFYRWLERNEVHEYRFLSVDYAINGAPDGELLQFRATLIPYSSDKRTDASGLFRDRIRPLRELVARAKRIRIRVVVPPTVIVRLDPGELSLPLVVSSPLGATESRLTLLPPADDSAGGRLRQFFD